mmetsp:Transcript_9940/g.23480  ORF Transcript_9940/g.23480 Transcript_9940/m.23480 type:complete len:312 (+) Transcript_9940:545-1480(+)
MCLVMFSSVRLVACIFSNFCWGVADCADECARSSGFGAHGTQSSSESATWVARRSEICTCGETLAESACCCSRRLIPSKQVKTSVLSAFSCNWSSITAKFLSIAANCSVRSSALDWSNSLSRASMAAALCCKNCCILPKRMSTYEVSTLQARRRSRPSSSSTTSFASAFCCCSRRLEPASASADSLAASCCRASWSRRCSMAPSRFARAFSSSSLSSDRRPPPGSSSLDARPSRASRRSTNLRVCSPSAADCSRIACWTISWSCSPARRPGGEGGTLRARAGARPAMAGEDGARGGRRARGQGGGRGQRSC